MVPCNENLCLALRNEARGETTGEDNLKTLRLVFDTYESAAGNRVIALPRG
jgi:hypothetical protein